jgi:ATP-binding cassette, subfamily B, multidrug efflux pump
MAEGDNKSSNKTSIAEFRSLFSYFRKYSPSYIVGFFFLIVVDAAQVILPQFIRQAVDIASSGTFEIKKVIIPCAVMVCLMGIVSLGRFFWRYFIHGASRRIETELRENLFERLLSLSYDFYQKNKIGDLMARATNDLNAVRESIGMGLVALVDGTVMAAAILLIIFIQDTRTAAFAVLPLPLITVLILLFGNVIGKRFRRAQETYSALSDAVQETFSGVRVVKSFVKEWWFIKKFADTNDDYRDANMELVKLFGIFFPLITFLSGLTVLIVLLVGGISVTEGSMSPGSLVALFRYLNMLIWPLMGAGFVVNMIQRGAVSLGRVNEVMRAMPLISSPPEAFNDNNNNNNCASSSEPGAPLIELRNLTFGFSDGFPEETPVLENINLSINEGTVTGILGRTGSGKSTLIKAITRMIAVPPGTVFIKGVESSAWDLTALRKIFGVTPQDSYLFSDSIKNNIGYAVEMEEGNEEILTRAASIAALDGDFLVLFNGWNTLIGERGLTLSGGQKQRAAIARSVAADREILILDDSLSSVDAETEKKILDALFELGREKRRSGLPWTMIIVSHRVSALSRSDEVIVLEKGRIIEKGTPAELASGSGFYARTAALQSLGAKGSVGGSVGGEGFA